MQRRGGGEWRYLSGALDEFHIPRFRWTKAPGPRAEDTPDSSRSANMWRQLGMRFQESAAMSDGHLCSPALANKVLRRHIAKAAQVANDLASLLPCSAAIVSSWLLASLQSLASRSFDITHLLVTIAREKAERLERDARRAACKEWSSWLRGSGSQSVTSDRRSQQPNKRAYQFVRGSVGWTRSPLGDPRYEDEGEFEDDLPVSPEDSATSEQRCGRQRIWSPCDGRQGDVVPLCVQAAVELEADSWAAEWDEHAFYNVQIDASLASPPVALEVAGIRQAAMSFPVHTGLGPDNVAPRAIARLSDRLLEWLVLIFASAERLGSWPAALRLVMIILIPKPDGGRRPIGLFPTLVRIWMRSRSYIARAWEAANLLPCFFGGVGRGAQRAAWLVAFNAETAARQGMHYAQSLLDLVKAFERLPHRLIVAAAQALGYCLSTLRLSLAAYRIPRVLGADGVYSRVVVASRGITAGSVFATTELRLLLHNVIVITMKSWPAVKVTLYVDDATLEAYHRSMRVTQATIAGATDCMVSMLQDDLGLECSAKKSLCVGSCAGLAARVARACRTKMLTPKRSAKLLGTSSGGGRRRSTLHSKVRLHAFNKRAARIARLQRAGICTARVVRAAGTPMVMYGVDTIGMSGTDLLAARRTIARTVCPEAGGKHYEVALHVVDGARGTVDPIFDAHGLPIWMWALAHWEGWLPHAALDKAVRQAACRVLTADGGVRWSLVTGPAAAVVASAHRLGWRFESGHALVGDDGAVYDLRLDPPVIVLQAVHRAARGWRLKRIGLVFPHLLPEVPDAIVLADRAGLAPDVLVTTVFGFADVLDGLMQSRCGSTCKVFDEWEPKHGAFLRSAITGGQWPQARIVAVPGWFDDWQCQLCHSAVGTLAHRLECPATLPPLGWQRCPPECEATAANLTAQRLDLLRSRGIFAFSIRHPAVPAEATFGWIWPPPGEWPEGSRVFIDGSLFDESRRWARRTGFGVVVVSPEGSLLAFGSGTPPGWVVDAAGAELWAFYVIASMLPFLPHVVTDCKGIIDGLSGSPMLATGPKKALARIWNMLAHVLDGDFVSARGLVTWMPAHCPASSIGHARDSRGRPIDATMWRANRLADALAKVAAAKHRLPAWAVRQVEQASRLYLHQAAKLGKITFDANHFQIVTFDEEGNQVTRMARDSTAARPQRRGRKRPRLETTATELRVRLAGSASSGAGGDAVLPGEVLASRGMPRQRVGQLPTEIARHRKRAAEALGCQLREDVQAAVGVAQWVSALELHPSAGPSASDRLCALRARVSARQRDGHAGVPASGPAGIAP